MLFTSVISPMRSANEDYYLSNLIFREIDKIGITWKLIVSVSETKHLTVVTEAK